MVASSDSPAEANSSKTDQRLIRHGFRGFVDDHL